MSETINDVKVRYMALSDSKKELEAELQTKDAEIERLKNRDCLGCGLASDKIDELEGEVERLGSFTVEGVIANACVNEVNKNKTLTAQLELLTKCVDSCEEYGFVDKCQGCKSKALLENSDTNK